MQTKPKILTSFADSQIKGQLLRSAAATIFQSQ